MPKRRKSSLCGHPTNICVQILIAWSVPVPSEFAHRNPGNRSGVFFGGIKLSFTRHSEVTEVVVGFSRSGDGHNYRQGAAFARAEMQLPEGGFLCVFGTDGSG